MKNNEKQKQFLTIDITDINNIKSEVNVNGIMNQLIMINCLSQVISQMSDKTRNFYDILSDSIINFEDNGEGNSEVAMFRLKKIMEEIESLRSSHSKTNP